MPPPDTVEAAFLQAATSAGLAHTITRSRHQDDSWKCRPGPVPPELCRAAPVLLRGKPGQAFSGGDAVRMSGSGSSSGDGRLGARDGDPAVRSLWRLRRRTGLYCTTTRLVLGVLADFWPGRQRPGEASHPESVSVSRCQRVLCCKGTLQLRLLV